MKLFLVRHGETAWNQQRRVQGGGSDIPLTPRGQEQARRVAQALQGEGIEALYSSPLSRARSTAQAIAEALSLPVTVMEEFEEMDTGDLDGLTFESLPRDHPDFWQEWRLGTGSLRWPGGESLEEMGERTWRGVLRLQEKHPQGTVAVVAHTFTVLTILLQALRLPSGFWRRLRLEPGGLSALSLGPQGASLLRFNDTCHQQGI